MQHTPGPRLAESQADRRGRHQASRREGGVKPRCFFIHDPPKVARLPKERPVFCSYACALREALQSTASYQWCDKHCDWSVNDDGQECCREVNR